MSHPFSVRLAGFLLLLIAVAPAARSANAPAPFDEGNKLYDAQEYSAARDRYEQLVSDGSYTANVFFNLGNAEFRLGHSGRAILAYERTLLLDPNHPEATANLALVRAKAGAKTLPGSPLDAFLLPISAPNYVLIGAIAFWMAVLTGVAFLLWRHARPLLATVCAMGLLCAAYCGTALVRDRQHRAVAVVVSPEVTARLEAADRAGVAETLPAGSDVRVLNERGAWVYCELPGRGRGWLPRKAIERIAPGATSA